MNDDYDNAKADKAILEKLTIDRDDDEADYRAEGTAECGCTFRQNRKDYETEVEYCKLHGAAPRLLEQLVKTANHVHAAYCIRNKAGCVAACENARALITEIEL